MLSTWIAAPIVDLLRVGRMLPPANVFHALGGHRTAEKLAMTASLMQQQPVAIQPRYMQTLVESGAEQNTTIFLHLPIGIISSAAQALSGGKRTESLAGQTSVNRPLPLLRRLWGLRG